MKRNIYILLVLSLVVFSCKKNTIETLPESNEPIFYLNGTFGNNAISAVAGVDGITMINGVEMRNGVQYAFGELSSNTTSYKLGFYDGNLEMIGDLSSLNIGDSLRLASKFSDNLANLYKSNFSNDGNITNVDWYVDGLFKGSNQVIITDPGKYNVCGNFTFANGVQKSICNTMFLGFEENVEFSIKHFLSEDGDLKLWIEGNTQDYDSVVWQIGNERINTAGTYSTNIGNVVQSISATVYHQNGAVREKNMVIDGTFSGNYIEDFSVCQVPSSQAKWDFSVGLETKINGESYSSFEVANYKSYVVVKNIQLHKLDSEGNQVLRITVVVDAMVKSKSSGTIRPIHFDAVLAYPVPK